MWPINFEDLDKLHLSIGMGLMVAAFIMWLFFTAEAFDSFDKSAEGIKDDYEFVQQLNNTNNKTLATVEQIEKFRESQNFLMNNKINSMNYNTRIFLYLGLFFFILGYVPFAWNHILRDQIKIAGTKSSKKKKGILSSKLSSKKAKESALIGIWVAIFVFAVQELQSLVRRISTSNFGTAESLGNLLGFIIAAALLLLFATALQRSLDND